MPSYSVITTCARRWDFLFRSLPSWRALPGRRNIFVVTCSFDEVPREGLEREHVVVVRDDSFQRAKVSNTGAQVAARTDGAEYFLMIDADIIVTDAPRFLKRLGTGADYILDSPYALYRRRATLNREQDPERAMRGLRGTHFVRSELFLRIHGYNQRMRGWGYEDGDLFLRYSRVSDRAAFYDRSALQHQPHDDSVRGQLQGESLAESLKRNRAEMQGNPDPYGGAWAADFGYASFEHRPPGFTTGRPA